jgi:hypothetical protein
MIFAVLRLLVVGFVLMTAAYWLISVYSRSVRREKLEKRFDEGDVEGDRDAYIEAGMAAYDKGLRKKLIWLVYVVPTGVVLALIYILNFE